MLLNPHLSFNGQCEDAFRYYADCLRGEISFMMSYQQSPMADTVPANWRNKIVHATLTIGAQRLSGADDLPSEYAVPRGISVMLQIPDPAEAERIFGRLADRGSQRLPLQETFWAVRFGIVVDRFAIPWLINSGKPQQ